MTKDEALKHALEKFEYMNHVDSIFHDEFDFQINAIKKALAQQAEPVAWMNGRGDVFKNPDDAERGQTLVPLYTTPPQRKPDPVIDKSAAIRIATALGWTPPRQPLTDEEIKAIAKPHNDIEIPMTGRMWVFVAELMDKLKEKNNA